MSKRFNVKYKGPKSTIPLQMTISRRISKVVYLDLNNRGYEVISMGSDENDVPCVIIDIVEDSEKERDYSSDYITQIDFPTYKGYDIVTASIFKYTLVVCFLKNNRRK